MNKVRTAQIDNKLFIMDGESPMRYVDLETNKVHVYPGKYMHFYFVVPKPRYWVISILRKLPFKHKDWK